MQLRITTDYAIRAIVYIATVGRIASSQEIAQKMGIPRKYLINITALMKDAGLIETQSGINGGYALARPAEEISLFDIISAMEGTTRINRCLEDDEYCSRFATSDCPVRRVYTELQGKMEGYLKEITVASIVKNR